MSKNLNNIHRKRKPCRSKETNILSKRYRKSNCTISDLSDATLLNIFRKMPEEDLVFNVPLVCKRWKNLVGDRKLSCRRLFACSLVAGDTLLKWIKAAPCLEDLTLYNRQDTDKILSVVSKVCRNRVIVKIFNGTDWNTQVVWPEAWLNNDTRMSNRRNCIIL